MASVGFFRCGGSTGGFRAHEQEAAPGEIAPAPRAWASGTIIAAVRYYRCLQCGVTEKTVERSVSPDPETELLGVVQLWFADRNPCYLREHGITVLPLYRLSALLARQGFVIHAAKGHDPKQLVACIGRQGRIERYGLFTLQSV